MVATVRVRTLAAMTGVMSGGVNGTADGVYASVSGGASNNATGDTSSISAGLSNVASGPYASASGGWGCIRDTDLAWGVGSPTTAVCVLSN